MKNNYLIKIMLLAIISLFGCKKEEKLNTKFELLIGKRWKIISMIENGNELLNSSYPSCKQDDFVIFSPNNTYANQEGTTKCIATDPQIKDEGSWSVDSDILYMQSDLLPVKSSVIIKELTRNKLVLHYASYYDSNFETTTYIAE